MLALFICGEKGLFTLFKKSLFLVYYVDNSFVSIFNSHPVEGRDMLDTAGVIIGLVELELLCCCAVNK